MGEPEEIPVTIHLMGRDGSLCGDLQPLPSPRAPGEVGVPAFLGEMYQGAFERHEEVSIFEYSIAGGTIGSRACRGSKMCERCLTTYRSPG